MVRLFLHQLRIVVRRKEDRHLTRLPTYRTFDEDRSVIGRPNPAKSAGLRQIQNFAHSKQGEELKLGGTLHALAHRRHAVGRAARQRRRRQRRVPSAAAFARRAQQQSAFPAAAFQ